MAKVSKLKNDGYFFWDFDWTLGPMRLVSRYVDGRLGLARIEFIDQRHAVAPTEHWQQLAAPDALFNEAAIQLQKFSTGQLKSFQIPLAPEGTPFQLAVWRQIAAIEFGQFLGYGEIAHALGKPSASRAVGAATGKNPLGIVVPCHRVIGKSGALTGYAGGLERKVALLDLETGRTPTLRALPRGEIPRPTQHYLR